MSWRLNPRDLTGAWILTEAELNAIRNVLGDVDCLNHLAALTEQRGHAWRTEQFGTVSHPTAPNLRDPPI